jgi:hypothetical protein
MNGTTMTNKNNFPDGPGYSPDGGSFWARDGKLYWEDGDVTSADIFFRSMPCKHGIDYSAWTPEQFAAKKRLSFPDGSVAHVNLARGSGHHIVVVVRPDGDRECNWDRVWVRTETGNEYCVKLDHVSSRIDDPEEWPEWAKNAETFSPHN